MDSERFPFALPDFVDSAYLQLVSEIQTFRGQAKSASGHTINSLELNALFADLADLASARIEGNQTTVLDALSRPSQRRSPLEQLKELDNLREATSWVAHHDTNGRVSLGDVLTIHQKVVNGLEREGDATPGAFRRSLNAISNSPVQTSLPALIDSDMALLVDAMNAPVPAHMEIAMVAMCHHRFTTIHTFHNGNGRTARLLTMLHMRHLRYENAQGISLTPTAIFGRSRGKYYSGLAAADSGTQVGLTEWVRFVAEGVRDDMRRLNAIGDHDFVMSQIVEVATRRARALGDITDREASIVTRIADLGVAAAGKLEEILPGSPSVRSQKLRPIIERGLIAPVAVGGRAYHVRFKRGPLLPHVLVALESAGIMPAMFRD
jgi:Fic family protein